MTATAYALARLRAPKPSFGPMGSAHGRAHLLALAALADEALDSPNGYTATSDAQVAAVTGAAVSTAASWLRTLVESGVAVRVTTHTFRIPEAAFEPERTPAP